MAGSSIRQWVPEASPLVCDLLSGSRGLVDPPIRAELFGLQRFAQHGRSLGETHDAAKPTWQSATFFPRLRGNIRVLREAQQYIGAQARTGYDVSPAAEWLLDNFHLIEAQLKEIHEALPRSYFRTLPVLVNEPLAGLPRIYSVAWAYVAHTDGAFDEDMLVQFLTAYQTTRELRLGEMWALPTTLRVVLVENLRRLAERVATNKAAREAANLCCDHIETYSLNMLDDLLAQLTRRGVERVFLGQMALRLQDFGAATLEGLQSRQSDHHREWLRQHLPDPAALQAQQIADQTADNLSVSNAVTSLRAIGDADWSDIVASTSALMLLMLGSPLFKAEHATTRDQTLHGIELLAQRSGRSELAVATTLLGLLPAPGELQSEEDVPGYWLAGPGRPALLRKLGLHESATLAARLVAHMVAWPLYLATLLLSASALVAWTLLHHRGGWTGTGLPVWLTLLGALVMLVPASEAVMAVINRLVSESVQPQHLPRLAFATGVTPEHRVMVVIPAMLIDTASIDQLAHRLLLHHLANPECQAQFALLTDWADADTEQTEADAGLLQHAAQQIRMLNEQYAGPADEVGDKPRDIPPFTRFILLHRPRSFSPTEQRWIGWERKRGKLEQLIAALAPAPSAPDAASRSKAFSDLGVDSQMADNVRYVVTLDSDTQLPPGRLRELVGVAAHPHNQPRLDAAGRQVVSGYGILQPRIVTPLPGREEVTLFHWLFAGQCGMDPYSAASSEVYQDLFSEGTFTGKGLLNVQAMQAVLGGRLPDGQVLSHDLLEGSLARCAAVTDITLVEESPFHPDVAASRQHRWMRGDWQLLAFLLSADGQSLPAINRWKMFDNLRRSLVAPASLALLLLALLGLLLSPWAALAWVLAAYAAGPVLGAVASFSPNRYDLAKRHFVRQAGIGLLRAACGGLWHVAQLLQQARWALDAIVRTLYRMVVSHRHLLQWTTAASAQAAVRTNWASLLSQHRQEPALALAMVLALLVAHTPHPVWSVALCLLWAASPVWTWLVSRPRGVRLSATLPGSDRTYLEGLARDTWRLFERCVGPEDNHLPPDNLQTAPHDMVAHRTSPTNIGLYLLSVACARAFGWISTQNLLTRIEATLATLRRLERHRGHFLNWYDTQTCAPLLPRYVSTVDSGNLSGHLLTVAQACLELARACTDAALARRLSDVAAQAEQLAWQADYSFLYHHKRHLFHIGYRVAEQQLDAGFYDLLASESRLTSLLAIAKGDAPVRHWASLGRPFFAVGASVGLRSWSGSMFEYLMPALVLDEPYGSVLRDACDAAVREQIAFAQLHRVPWGISESAYSGRDNTLAYQYAPQGVPRLALRRTPPDELVIAPYATALAALVAPRRACLNYDALENLSARGRYGFIEALDYCPERQSDASRLTRVHTYMAHHQGMTIVALANVLLGGVAQRWGMANPHIEAVASLLHERAPREVSRLYEPLLHAPIKGSLQRTAGLLREVVPGMAAVEPTHLLSNGRYNVALRANGAGCSRWGKTGINRWRDDALRDAYGSFFYVRWDQHPQLSSITQHPAPDPAAHYRSVYHADRVCFDAAWPDVQAHATVWVSPEDDIEFRQIELRNMGDRAIDIELISAFEVALNDPRADEAHPAFTNLFVAAEWLAADRALLFERKPRLHTDRALQAMHFLADADPQILSVRHQTDRQSWLGRNRDASQPQAVFGEQGHESPAALDTGLDPMCVLAVRLRIAAHGKALLTFATAVSDNAGTLRALLDKYRQTCHVERASLMSATLAGIRLRTLRMGPEPFAAIQTLTTALALCLTRPASGAARVGIRTCDRRLLWPLGISGDRPIVLVSAGTLQGLGLLRSLAQALRLWSWGGLACDLVVANTEAASYQMSLQREIAALRARHESDSGFQSDRQQPHSTGSTGFYALNVSELSHDQWTTLKAMSRVHFQADGRPLQHHVQEWSALHEQAMAERLGTSTAQVPVVAAQPATAAPPAGAFDPASGEFRFKVSGASRPQRPWINVLANPGFGAQISEAGGGNTWAVNSRLNQLTAWSNDPVVDAPSEWFWLQDCRTMEVWSIAPPASLATQDVVHGQGYTRISHRLGDLQWTATWCVDPVTSVKQIRLQLLNLGDDTLELRVVGMVEWLMGAQRADRSTVVTAHLPLAASEQNALLCTQQEQSAGFGGGTAFLCLADAGGAAGAAAAAAEAGDAEHDWTCDRREFFDARGRMVLPDYLGQRSGSGLDPCAALSARLRLAGGASAVRTFLLGYADSPALARQLVQEALTVASDARLERARQSWSELLGATTVKTPDPLFDAMVNRWLLYQTVSCRLWAKAAFYQAGGATGFRDQLQDAMALAWAAPQMLRQQIELAASRQFAEGDVQHWWHTPGGAGVRTHFSDDLLWLPHACVHYVRATADVALLDCRVPFIEGVVIAPGAEDAYDTPRVSLHQASVYEHAARAIDHSLRVGVHGLPLMGTGDWNDGMNRVGHEGRGESVWLGWFLCRIVADFAPLARERGELERAQAWEDAALAWSAALNSTAWDGLWFTRAYFDDGSALGSHANAEARIDLIAQAWSVLSRAGDPAKQRLAMHAVETWLVDAEAGLIKLLDPPLQYAEPSAGYIQAYPPGVRENGGQYSHAGVWALMAQAELARQASDQSGFDTAYRYFTYLSPAHRAADAVRGPAYGGEPYVMAGDVYTAAPHAGRGGWSWYTGAAAWMHRAAIESIFGLQQDAHTLCFRPGLPLHWDRAEISLRRGRVTLRFVLMRAASLYALDAAALAGVPDGAELLLPGQALAWPSLEQDTCFVVPLTP